MHNYLIFSLKQLQNNNKQAPDQPGCSTTHIQQIHGSYKVNLMFINNYHGLFLAHKVYLEQQHGFVYTGIQEPIKGCS